VFMQTPQKVADMVQATAGGVIEMMQSGACILGLAYQ